MSELTITITLPAPKPVTVPVGFPKATITSLDIADSSGRVCGTLQIEGVESPDGLGFGFEAGETTTTTLIEDPNSEYGEYSELADFSSVLPDDVPEWEYREYLRSVVDAADIAFRNLGAVALEATRALLLDALNGERA